ncbi:MAG TPA: response regulator [Nitrososphaeraceae archaeon]|nr:response regulator [Nitrososphaeraceae archaeon]
MGLNHSNANSNNKHILVVNNESDIVDIIRFCLQTYGYKVCTFIDPLVALEHFKSNSKNHHIVISDATMPSMNGFEFLKQVKKINPKVKVALTISFEIWDTRELSNVSQDVEIDAFIKKPFSPNTLIKALIQQK